jgi:hypothetical protein
MGKESGNPGGGDLGETALPDRRRPAAEVSGEKHFVISRPSVTDDWAEASRKMYYYSKIQILGFWRGQRDEAGPTVRREISRSERLEGFYRK